MVDSPYGFTYCAASEDDSLYLTGVVEKFEEQDIRHTILWERIGGHWERYQWNNRTYGLVVYPDFGRPTAAYLGYEGTLKVRSQVKGSSVQLLESGDDAPSSLRSVASIRHIGEYLFVVGMRRIVYRRALEEAHWSRFDKNMRLKLADNTIAGLRAIDGKDSERLVAVGLEGEIWVYIDGKWSQDDSPTNIRLSAVRHVGNDEFVISGADGMLISGRPGSWHVIQHDFMTETFRCIEVWSGRCFVGTESGRVYDVTIGLSPALTPFTDHNLPFVSWLSSTRSRIYFLGKTSAASLGADGWRDESPRPDLLI
jgi:hypothetical protein